MKVKIMETTLKRSPHIKYIVIGYIQQHQLHTQVLLQPIFKQTVFLQTHTIICILYNMNMFL